jgi:hypothetical protein
MPAPKALERPEQRAVLQFVAVAMPGAVALHIPNESPAGDGWRRRMVADGALPGAPDLFVVQPRTRATCRPRSAGELEALAERHALQLDAAELSEMGAAAALLRGFPPYLAAFLEMKRPGWKPAKPGTAAAAKEERQRAARELLAATGIPVGLATTLEEAVSFFRAVGFHIIAKESAL